MSCGYGKVKHGRKWLMTRPTIGGRKNDARVVASFDEEAELDAVINAMDK